MIGFLDTIRYFGTLFGTLWILIYPAKKLKLTFFSYSCIKCILIGLLACAKVFPSFAEIYLSVIIFGIGFTKNVNYVLFVIVNRNMNLENEE